MGRSDGRLWGESHGRRHQNQDRALRLLGDHETAAVGNKTDVTDDAGLVIHSETALVLLHFEFIEREDDRVRITRDGLVKIGRVTESRAERKAKAMARSLKAQRSGEWVPAAAGESAAAQRDKAEDRRWRAQSYADLTAARSELSREREWLRAAREWGDDNEIGSAEQEVERWETRVAAAKAAVDALPSLDQAA